ncbi:MAG: glycosyltransferase family 4 protein [Planctomycetota bacterium]
MLPDRSTVAMLIGGHETGGLATVIRQLLAGVDRQRYTLRLLVCDVGPYATGLQGAGWTCDSLQIGPPPLLRQHTGYGVQRLWSAHLRSVTWAVRGALALARYVRRHRVDLIYTHYYHYHGLSGLAHLLCGVKCVWHWHGQESRAGLLKLAPLIRRLIRPFGWFIAISAATRESIQGLAGDRVTVVYNGLPQPQLCCRRRELRDMLGLPPDARIVGMVGTLHPIKGHLDALDAAAQICQRHADVHFVFIGGHTGPLEAYRERVLQRRRELGLEHRAHFLGHRDDAAELISGFDIKILTTLPPGEGFGLVIIEAMARCVPVIATDVGAPREILTHDQTGILVPPSDPAALARAIEDLLADPQRRQRLGQAGYAAFCDRFDIRRTVREIEAVWDRLLKRPALVDT